MAEFRAIPRKIINTSPLPCVMRSYIVKPEPAIFDVGKSRAIRPPDRVGRTVLNSVRVHIVNRDRLFCRDGWDARKKNDENQQPAANSYHLISIVPGTLRWYS